MAKNKSGVQIGFVGLLTIAFIVLKLCNVITWSWWWVLAPMWAGTVVILVFFLLFILYKAFA